jgi:hypothetical protein
MSMKIKIQNIQTYLSTIAFFALFPGFFLYHFSIAKGYFPPVLGGYFGLVAAFLFVPLFFINIKIFMKKQDLIVAIFFLILGLMFIVSISQYLLQNPNGYVKEMFVWSISGLFFNFVTFMVAARLNLNLVARLGFWLIFLMFLAVIFNIGDYGIFYLKQETGSISEYVATYQGFARSIVVTLLIVSAFYFRTSKRFYLLILLGVVALFLNGSRSEFAFFVLAITFMYLIYSMTSIKAAFSFLLFAFIATFAVVSILDFSPDSRMSQLLNIASSSSGERRAELFMSSIELIKNSPLLGEYAGYTELGGIGSYSHNILSAWVNLGLLGFTLYFLMFILLWRDALLNFSRYKNFDLFKVYLIFLVFVTGTLLFSKNYSYMLVGLLLGFYVQYRNFIKGLK